MNRRIIMIALGALVAGAFALVYAEGDKGTSHRIAAGAASGQDVGVTGATNRFAAGWRSHRCFTTSTRCPIQ